MPWKARDVIGAFHRASRCRMRDRLGGSGSLLMHKPSVCTQHAPRSSACSQTVFHTQQENGRRRSVPRGRCAPPSSTGPLPASTMPWLASIAMARPHAAAPSVGVLNTVWGQAERRGACCVQTEGLCISSDPEPPRRECAVTHRRAVGRLRRGRPKPTRRCAPARPALSHLLVSPATHGARWAVSPRMETWRLWKKSSSWRTVMLPEGARKLA